MRGTILEMLISAMAARRRERLIACGSREDISKEGHLSQALKDE